MLVGGMYAQRISLASANTCSGAALPLWTTARSSLVVAYLPALELGRDLREQGVLDAPRHPKLLLDGMIEGLDLSVGSLKVFARALGSNAAAHEHPGDPEEQEAHSDTACEHEGGQLALYSLLKPRQSSEVQAPLASGHLDAALLGEEELVLPLSGAFYAVAIIEGRARRRILTVVDLEVYGGVERPTEDPIEQLVAHERTDNISLERAPPLGEGPLQLTLQIDREIHDETGMQGEVRAGVRGGLGEHIDPLCRPRLSGVPRPIHSGPVGGVGVQVVVEHVLVSLAEGTGVCYREVRATFPAGIQVGPQLGQAFLPCTPCESLSTLGRDVLGVAEGLEALEVAARLYAFDVVPPLLTIDRLTSVEEPAGAQHSVEVGFRAALYGLLGSLGGLVEAKAVLGRDVVADVVGGEEREEKRD